MSLPPNFGRAVDLSSLTKPAQATNAIASNYEITAENFATNAVELSRTKPVILLVAKKKVLLLLLIQKEMWILTWKLRSKTT